MYILGIITGLLIALFIATILTYFRRVIEHKINTIERYIDSSSPKPQGGFIIEPLDDAEEARQQIIARNKAKGISTKLKDLYE